MHSPTPWSLKHRGGDNPRNVIVVDAREQCVLETDWVPTQEEYDDYMRIVACVDACQDFSTEFLQDRAKSLLPLPLDCPDGDVLAQARAWTAAWKALWNAGMSSFLPTPLTGNGADRAVQFIEQLASWYNADAAAGLVQNIKELREERISLLMTVAAIINQFGGEVRLSDIHIHALRPDSFQVESYKDTDNRCIVLRVAMKE